MAQPESKARQGRMATLDLLRLVAALAVVCFHYLFRGEIAADGHGQAFAAASSVAIYGYLGVNLFFIISGFVIAWSAEGRDFARFALARFARLYPGFLTCMAITFVVLLIAANPAFGVSWAQFAANLIMFAPALGQPFMDGVYWSIILEVIFYGWVATALFFGVFGRWKTGLLLSWLVVCALNEYGLDNGALRLVFITEYGPLFVSGVLLHHMHAHGRSLEHLAMLAASFAMSTAAMTGVRDWMLLHYGEAVGLPGLVAANLAIYALAIGAVATADRVAPGKTILMLGGLTYPLYLLHQNIGYVAIAAIAPVAGAWSAFAVVLVAMLLASWAVWRFIETPARRAIIRAAGPYADRAAQFRPARPASAVPAE